MHRVVRTHTGPRTLGRRGVLVWDGLGNGLGQDFGNGLAEA